MTRFMTEMELVVAEAMGGDGCEDYWIGLARIAIRAMRTPTTEMLREAGMVVAGNTEAHATVWETMIDAASPQEE